MKSILSIITHCVRLFCLRMIGFYQAMKPLIALLVLCFGGQTTQCLYPESCSHFARRHLKEASSVRQALTTILLRLISCIGWKRPLLSKG